MPGKNIRGDLMKKIVSTTIIVATQLLVGGLFFVTLFTSEQVDNKVVIVENNNLGKMVDNVYKLNVDAETQEVGIKENEEIVENKENFDANIEANDDEAVDNKKVSSNVEDYEVLETYTGVLTGYGPDCVGCSGITASGYDVRNTITYTDSEFGEIRIVAADRQFELYSIVRISNAPGMDPIIAIVLDRGSNVGFGKGTLFDLLYTSESISLQKTEGVTFEILRRGN